MRAKNIDKIIKTSTRATMMNARKSTAKFAGLVSDLAKERGDCDKSVDEGTKARTKSINIIQEHSKETQMTGSKAGAIDRSFDRTLPDRRPKKNIESSITLGAQSNGEEQDEVPNALGS